MVEKTLHPTADTLLLNATPAMADVVSGRVPQPRQLRRDGAFRAAAREALDSCAGRALVAHLGGRVVLKRPDGWTNDLSPMREAHCDWLTFVAICEGCVYLVGFNEDGTRALVSGPRDDAASHPSMSSREFRDFLRGYLALTRGAARHGRASADVAADRRWASQTLNSARPGIAIVRGSVRELLDAVHAIAGRRVEILPMSVGEETPLMHGEDMRLEAKAIYMTSSCLGAKEVRCALVRAIGDAGHDAEVCRIPVVNSRGLECASVWFAWAPDRNTVAVGYLPHATHVWSGRSFTGVEIALYWPRLREAFARAGYRPAMACAAHNVAEDGVIFANMPEKITE